MRQSLIAVSEVRRSVQSITACTAPSVQVGRVVAVADRLCSPYKSRHGVVYKVAANPVGFAAWNTRAAILIDGGELDAFPIDGCVTHWEQVTVPVSLVRPLFLLAERLGLDVPPYLCNGQLIASVRVLTKTLAGFNGGCPVFWAASGDGRNEPVLVNPDRAIARQGHLYVFAGEDVPPMQFLPALAPGEEIFNHRLECEGDFVASAAAAGVLLDGRPAAAVGLWGPALITSPDHDPLSVDEGYYVLVHEFPAPGRDAD